MTEEEKDKLIARFKNLGDWRKYYNSLYKKTRREVYKNKSSNTLDRIHKLIDSGTTIMRT